MLAPLTACDDNTDAEGFGPMLWAYASDEHSRFPGDETTISVPTGGKEFRFRCVSRHLVWFAGAEPAETKADYEIAQAGFYKGTMENATFTISFEPNTTGEERELTVNTAGYGGAFTFIFRQP